MVVFSIAKPVREGPGRMKTDKRVIHAVALAAALACTLQVSGQLQKEWVQPYPRVPGYWEMIGRFFPDSDVLRRDRSFRGFLDPSVLAVAALSPRARRGDVLATIVPFQPMQTELNANTAPERVVVGTVTQVLYAFAEKGTIRVEVRSGYPSSEFQQCADARLQRFPHLLDARLQAVMRCAGAISWTPYRASPIPLDAKGRATLPLEDLGALAIAYDARGASATASLQAP